MSTSEGQVGLNQNGKRLGVGLVLFLIFLQLWSRYVPNVEAVFVADDWVNWARSSAYETTVEAFRTGLKDPNRPLSMAAVESVFRIFDRDALKWTLLSIAANSLLLFAVIWMAWALTRRVTVAFMAGVIFALLPNLTETYHWSTQILNEVSCGLVFYGFSGCFWVLYTSRGGWWRLMVSVLTYAIALYSYEAGLLIPASYVFLQNWRNQRVKNLVSLAPFGLVLLSYYLWRTTNAFGLNDVWYYPPHMQAGLSLEELVWNVRLLVSWWVGDRMFGSLLSGIESFATLSSTTRHLLIVGNILAVVLIGIVWRGKQLREDSSTASYQNSRSLLFALAWAGSTMAILVVSYTAGRLNVLPAMGISILLSIMFNIRVLRRWSLLLFVPAVLCLTANQGTTESCRVAGLLNDRLLAHLQNNQTHWEEKEVVLLDTESMRQRLTPGLASPVSRDPATWAEYRNALLLRGFVVRGMVMSIIGGRELPVEVLHDVENGARFDDGKLLWHERFDPGRPRVTPGEAVYVLDAGSVLWMEAAAD